MLCYNKNVNECRQVFRIKCGDTLGISTDETLDWVHPIVSDKLFTHETAVCGPTLPDWGWSNDCLFSSSFY